MPECQDQRCYDSGYTHGMSGLVSMRPRCAKWSEGWRDGSQESKDA